MIRSNKFPFIALAEPFYKANKLEKYRRSLGYHNTYANNNSQIWLFWEEDLDCVVIDEDEKQITCIIKYNRISLLVSYVYSRCEEDLRK